MCNLPNNGSFIMDFRESTCREKTVNAMALKVGIENHNWGV